MIPYRTPYSLAGLVLLLLLANASETQAKERNFTDLRLHEARKIYSLHRKAERLMNENEFERAVNLYREITFIEPDDAVAYTNMGSAYGALGYTALARESYEDALDIEPDNMTALEGLRRIDDPDALAP